MQLESAGLNPYKQVEMFKNFRKIVPERFWTNSLYKKADQKILDKVKKEKQFRQEFQKELKTIKGREPG